VRAECLAGDGQPPVGSLGIAPKLQDLPGDRHPPPGPAAGFEGLPDLPPLVRLAVQFGDLQL
jgi:hypothetical protein